MCQTKGQEVDTLLTHAEQNYQRGAFKVAAEALRSAIRYHRAVILADPNLTKRAVAIKNQLVEARKNNPVQTSGGSTVHKEGACTHCNGTGRFKKFGKCVVCYGKGTITKEDLERNMNYWKRRQLQAAANEKAYADAFKEWSPTT